MRKNITDKGRAAEPAPPHRHGESLLPLFQQIYNAFAQYNTVNWSLPSNVPMILMHIHSSPAETAAEPAALADALHLPRQTVTFVLDTLEQRQWATRHPHPTDRRRIIIQLTPSGRQLAAQMVTALLHLEAAVLQNVTAAERQVFTTIIGRYVDALAGGSRPASEENKS